MLRRGRAGTDDPARSDVLQASRRTDRSSFRVVPIAAAGLFAASWLARWTYVAWGYVGSGPIGFTYTHQRIDAVLAGTLAAWLVRSRTLGGREKVALAVVAVASFLPTLSLEPYEHRVLFLVGVIPLQAIGFGCRESKRIQQSSLAEEVA